MTKRQLLKRLRNRAYKLWRECVLIRWGYKCVGCGEKKLPNCHHIVPKIFASLRYDPINGIVVCPKCHKFDNRFSAHKNLLWFAVLLVSKLAAGEIKYLIRKMTAEGRVKIEPTVEYYEGEIKKLEEFLKTKGATNGKS
jgi:ssDNA-binding Zn-finger/Zn-ribbon topoisomerase 1